MKSAPQLLLFLPRYLPFFVLLTPPPSTVNAYIVLLTWCHLPLQEHYCNASSIFQVISLEGWVDIMYYIQDAHSFWDWTYFVALIVVSKTYSVYIVC